MAIWESAAVKTISARDLKNRSGEVLRALRRGDSLILTFRGRPVGRIVPYAASGAKGMVIRDYEDAWTEIEDALKDSVPEFPTWREAEDRSRGRR